MFSIIRRLACVATVAVISAGCSERAPLASPTIPSPHSATDLPLVIPRGDLLATPSVDGRTVVTPYDSSRIPDLAAFGSSGSTAGHTSMANSADGWAMIRFPRSTAYFTQSNGVTVAGGEGSMDYFGTGGQNTTSVTLSTPTGSLLSATKIGMNSQPLPWWNTLVTHTLIPLPGSCGYSAMASTAHRAWQHVPFPPFTVFGEAYENSQSSPESLPSCPVMVPVTGIGGQGDSRITDSEWQICYWLVWYNSSGVEVLREFLYCTTF